ncbi:MAG: hemin receptor, partial [Coprococcus comes]|nr:hemin receptor [Coprococcus comes]
WKATNRITAGLGFNYQGWGFDVAYQYSAQKGDFYPFQSFEEMNCVAPVTEVKNNRHQLLMTLSYKF